jgi:hypothetical protein
MADADIPLSRVERAFVLADRAIGFAVVALGTLFAIGVLVAPPPDNPLMGVVGGCILVAYGLFWMAVGNVVRTRQSGRWIVQTLAMLPIAGLIYLAAPR